MNSLALAFAALVFFLTVASGAADPKTLIKNALKKGFFEANADDDKFITYLARLSNAMNKGNNIAEITAFLEKVPDILPNRKLPRNFYAKKYADQAEGSYFSAYFNYFKRLCCRYYITNGKQAADWKAFFAALMKNPSLKAHPTTKPTGTKIVNLPNFPKSPIISPPQNIHNPASCSTLAKTSYFACGLLLLLATSFI